MSLSKLSKLFKEFRELGFDEAKSLEFARDTEREERRENREHAQTMEKLKLDSAERMEKIRSDERVALENSTVQPGNYLKSLNSSSHFHRIFPI
jgi:hypothetical protein